MTIEPELWRKVIKADPNNRAVMLRIAATGGRSALECFLFDFMPNSNGSSANQAALNA